VGRRPGSRHQPRPEEVSRKLSFTTGCLFELPLLALALVCSALFRRPARADIYWSMKSTLVGVVAAIPPLLFFVWTLKSKLRVLARHRHLLECLLRPLFDKWSTLQLLAISVIAGICEEAFFRGALQGGLSERVDARLALIVASGLFGACHLLSWTYAVMAALIGTYLGLLWMGNGNLLTPMVTHAAYDFAALVYFLRIYRGG